MQAATIARLTRVNDSRASCTVYERLLRRWRTQRPTHARQLELALLQHATGQLRMLLSEIRALADDLTARQARQPAHRTTATRGLGQPPLGFHPQR